jgi:hypothetical protein
LSFTTVGFFEITAFDVWGELVFESYDADYGWDGTYGLGLNHPVQDGVFTWMVSLKMKEDEETIQFTGHVILIK